jgi:hypothetical protein
MYKPVKGITAFCIAFLSSGRTAPLVTPLQRLSTARTWNFSYDIGYLL